jgi:hypothetical protein
MHRKTTRYHPHAHDPMAKTWADDFTNLALNPGYEKSAAPLSKRRNGLYMGVDKSAGSFFGSPAARKLPSYAAPLMFFGGCSYLLAGALAQESDVDPMVTGLAIFSASSIAYFMFVN